MTHTPGPWRADKVKHGVFIMAGLYCVARLDSNVANHNLIAAAPELLEACKLMAKEQVYSYEIKKIMEQAIAKAEAR